MGWADLVGDLVRVALRLSFVCVLLVCFYLLIAVPILNEYVGLQLHES